MLFLRSIVFLRRDNAPDQQFTHLADVGFKRILPSIALRPVVKWFWYVRSHARIEQPRDEFMHPDGSMGLVFNWGDVLKLSHGHYQQGIAIGAVIPQSKQLRLFGSVEAFGILFRTGAAFRIFGIPMHELDQIDDAALYPLPAYLPQLHAQLYAASTLAEKVALAETWLMGLLQAATPPSRVIDHTLTLANRANGQLSIAQLAQAVYISPRQLERLYQQYVGLSPKTMARLLRIRQARTALKHHETRTLSDIAVACGFYDQAHFIREFKAVIGLTPGAYLARHQARLLGEENTN